MRIAIFPAGGDGTASSRIRAYSLQKALCALGHDARIRDATGAEVVLIQKRVGERELAIIDESRRNGALIVYDVDDVGRGLWHHLPPSMLHRVLQKADLITSPTAGHRVLLLRDYGATAVEIVPDTIDYYPPGPVRPPILGGGAALRMLWFGAFKNVALFSKYVPALLSVPGVELVAVTDPQAVHRLSARFPRVSFLPWSPTTFVDILRSCDLSVLSHEGTEIDRAKSNNRMIASITWGVPAVVSRTPEYERTASEAGVEYSLFSDEKELPAVIERLRSPEARRDYLAAAQPEVWRRYSPERVASRFLEVIGAARRRSGPPMAGYVSWLRRAARGALPYAIAYEIKHYLRRSERSS